jgi:acyl-CoA synthetase (AMP-forming)/AMP-acid ligase II
MLAGYKVPASIKIVVSLPKGGTGKIQKKLLRAEYWQGQEKQVH